MPDTQAADGAAGQARRRVYYFYAAHCGACRSMTPLVERLRPEHPNLIAVDVVQSPDLARGFGILGTPSPVLVEEGTIRRVKLGAQSERALLGLLTGAAP